MADSYIWSERWRTGLWPWDSPGLARSAEEVPEAPPAGGMDDLSSRGNTAQRSGLRDWCECRGIAYAVDGVGLEANSDGRHDSRVVGSRAVQTSSSVVDGRGEGTQLLGDSFVLGGSLAELDGHERCTSRSWSAPRCLAASPPSSQDSPSISNANRGWKTSGTRFAPNEARDDPRRGVVHGEDEVLACSSVPRPRGLLHREPRDGPSRNAGWMA